MFPRGTITLWPMRTKSYATPIQNCISGLALLKVRQDAVEFLAPCTELIQVRFYEFVTCNYYFPLPVFVMIGFRRSSKDIFDEDYIETIGPLRAARDVPKYDCPIFPLELHQLKKLIDPNIFIIMSYYEANHS